MHEFLIFVAFVAVFAVANYLGSEWQEHLTQKRMSLMFEAAVLADTYEPVVRANEQRSEQLIKQYRQTDDQRLQHTLLLRMQELLGTIYSELNAIGGNHASVYKRFATIRATTEYAGVCNLSERMSRCWHSLSEQVNSNNFPREEQLIGLSYAVS